MQRYAFPIIASVFFLGLCLSCSRNGQKNDPWPEPTGEMKPWTRWWWLGSDVDRENISSLMEQYAEAGFGGVEITPIFGVKGREDHYLEYLSPEWMEMLKTSVSEGGKLDMGVDMNLGTGWPFGGPQIEPENAASRLIIQKYNLEKGQRLEEKILPADPRQVKAGAFLEALMAYSSGGEILDLTALVGEDGTLDWMPGEGEWQLYAAFCGRTRQRVKRAAPGGEGYTMNHFSRSALDVYLARFEKAFDGYRGVRCFFNDSYEVYNASWSPGFFNEFQSRRGYDLKPYLKDLSEETENETTARVKSDYRQTMSELLLENFTIPWTQWSHSMGCLTKNQAHGSPGNLIDLYAAVDVPECEIYGHRDFDIPGLRENLDDTRNVEPNPMMLKLATSAAHVRNKPKISNETFTWLGEHFRVALSQCKPEVEEAFLAGINHVFYHGTAYSPEEAPWPGWLFYASVNFAPSNPFWSHLKGLNRYVTRCQSVLQSGRPDNEILVYWPVYDIWHNSRGMEMQLSVHNIMDWLQYPVVDRMTESGYCYDFISDALLEETQAAGGRLETAGGDMAYKVLVLPACRFMPLQTLQRIVSLAEGGGLVIFQELPGDVPGLRELDQRRESFRGILGTLAFEDAGDSLQECRIGKGRILLGRDVVKALEYAGVKGEKIGSYRLKFTRRATEDGKIYYLVNHSADAVDALIPFKTSAGSVLLLDPQDGTYGKAFTQAEGDGIRVRVQLPPGKSVFVRTLVKPGTCKTDWAYEESRGNPLVLEGDWRLEFLEGGPEVPDAVDLEELYPWTDLEDTLMKNFSGLAKYTLVFENPGIRADEVMLELGQVFQSARVRLNGHELGYLWSVPFEVKAGKFLAEGENTLEIEVANLMANRIRYMDRQGIPWRIFHEINFVNIQYRPFDASGWETEDSGLGGPVQLIPVHFNTPASKAD